MTKDLNTLEIDTDKNDKEVNRFLIKLQQCMDYHSIFLLRLDRSELTTFKDAPNCLTEEDVLTLKIAFIDGWSEVKLVDGHFVGVNKMLEANHGVNIPKYTDEISKVFRRFGISNYFTVRNSDNTYSAGLNENDHLSPITGGAKTRAIALCKLLISINPNPIKDESK